MIHCGWCGVPTERSRCASCRRDPTLPYLQRAIEPEPIDPHAEQRTALARADRELGPHATIDAIAEFLDVSPRTVRRWREMAR